MTKTDKTILQQFREKFFPDCGDDEVCISQYKAQEEELLKALAIAREEGKHFGQHEHISEVEIKLEKELIDEARKQAREEGAKELWEATKLEVQLTPYTYEIDEDPGLERYTDGYNKAVRDQQAKAEAYLKKLEQGKEKEPDDINSHHGAGSGCAEEMCRRCDEVDNR